MRIKKLTPEQEALIPVVRDEWIAHGLKTGPADRPEAESGIRQAYEAAGLQPPELVVWADSPMAGAIMAAMLPHVHEDVLNRLKKAVVVNHATAQSWADGGILPYMKDPEFAAAVSPLGYQLDAEEIWEAVVAQIDDEAGEHLDRARYDSVVDDIHNGNTTGLLAGHVDEDTNIRVGNDLHRHVVSQIMVSVLDRIYGELSDQAFAFESVTEIDALGGQIIPVFYRETVVYTLYRRLIRELRLRVKGAVGEPDRHIVEQLSDDVCDQTCQDAEEKQFDPNDVISELYAQVGAHVVEKATSDIDARLDGEMTRLGHRVEERVFKKINAAAPDLRSFVDHETWGPTEQITIPVETVITLAVREVLSSGDLDESLASNMRGVNLGKVRANIDDHDFIDQTISGLTWLVEQTVRATIRTMTWAEMGSTAADHVERPSWTDMTRNELWNKVRSQFSHAVYGQHEAGILAFCDYFGRIGVDVSPMEGMMRAGKNAGWWWPMKDAVVVSERPTQLHRDDDGRLHNPNGPAVAYPDGFSVYAWHGTRVPRELIMGEWDARRIFDEKNSEIRRCAVEHMADRGGWQHVVAQLDAPQVGDTVPDPGNPGQTLSLYRLANVYEEPVNLLLMVNGTIERDGFRREFGETVPEDVTDPVAAAAWQIGIAPEHYRATRRRT